jgi:hypothetical protein
MRFCFIRSFNLSPPKFTNFSYFYKEPIEKKTAVTDILTDILTPPFGVILSSTKRVPFTPVPLRKITAAEVAKKYPAFWGTPRFHHPLTRSCHFSLLSTTFHTRTHTHTSSQFLKIHFNIILLLLA